jgi:uncharacterized protein YdeI (YjbR/CyaY-like superfamily)
MVESGQRRKSIERPRKRAKKKAVAVPRELRVALSKNKLAAKAFAVFSPSCQNEYSSWIAEAKQDETRKKRVLQAIEWIANGKSRNWKYQKS